MKEQQNNRTNNRNLTYKGVTQTMKQWADEYNLSYDCFRQRISKGMPIEEALNTPPETRLINTNYTIDGITKPVK